MENNPGKKKEEWAILCEVAGCAFSHWIVRFLLFQSEEGEATQQFFWNLWIIHEGLRTARQGWIFKGRLGHQGRTNATDEVSLQATILK